MSISRFTPEPAGPEGGHPTPGADTRGVPSRCQVDCVRGWQTPVATHDEEAGPFFALDVGEKYGWKSVEPFPRPRDGVHS